MFPTVTGILLAATLAFPAMAAEVHVVKQPGTCIRNGSQCVRDGVFRLGLASDGTPYANSPDSAYPVQIDALGTGESIRCYWTGRATADVVTFTLSNSADYLHPCGPKDGITMICNGPAATCQS